MTNDNFIKLISAYVTDSTDVLEHAKKLIEVVEAAQTVACWLPHEQKMCESYSKGNICKCGIGNLREALVILEEK